ncbi:MAG: glycosyltransferase family 2 protein, partial [Proteobacteria bacterium]|nr:glycosyltransferase family 2 protein [Pseudomonadota bacterium]
LPRLFEEVTKLADSIKDYIWEFVLVNDGSKDNSLHVLTKQAQFDPRFKLVDLSRNFGKEVALSAGLHYCNGDAVIVMDADLQYPVHYIPQMLKSWKDGAEIVEMIRVESRKEPIARRIGSYLFYLILGLISETEILAKTTDFRLLNRSVVNELMKIDERHRMFRGLIDWLGFNKVQMEFVANERLQGVPVYSYLKLANLALNSFIGYSSLPLKLIGVLGAMIAMFSTFLFAFMIVTHFIDRTWFNFSSLSFVVVINTMLIGMVLSALGLMSLYISKIYAETQNRPLFVVRKVLNHQPRSRL